MRRGPSIPRALSEAPSCPATRHQDRARVPLPCGLAASGISVGHQRLEEGGFLLPLAGRGQGGGGAEGTAPLDPEPPPRGICDPQTPPRKGEESALRPWSISRRRRRNTS